MTGIHRVYPYHLASLTRRLDTSPYNFADPWNSALRSGACWNILFRRSVILRLVTLQSSKLFMPMCLIDKYDHEAHQTITWRGLKKQMECDHTSNNLYFTLFQNNRSVSIDAFVIEKTDDDRTGSAPLFVCLYKTAFYHRLSFFNFQIHLYSLISWCPTCEYQAPLNRPGEWMLWGM